MQTGSGRPRRKRKALLVVNPAAGASGATDPEKLTRLLGSHGIEVDCFLAGQDACVGVSEVVRGAESQGYEMVIAAGGDGTIRSVACAQTLPVTTLPVAILPLGTSNSIARSLGVPRDIKKACRLAATGRARRVDLGEAEGPNLCHRGQRSPAMNFLLCASAGFDAEAARLYERRGRRGGEGPPDFPPRAARSRRSSMLRYAVVAVRAALRFEHRDIYVSDSLTHQRIATGKLVIVSNCRHYGGWFRPSPCAVPTDGLLDLVAIRSYGIFGLAGAGVYALLGIPQRPGRSGIRISRAVRRLKPSTTRLSCLRLESDSDRSGRQVPFELDGEPAGTLPVELRVKAGALRIVTGTDATETRRHREPQPEGGRLRDEG